MEERDNLIRILRETLKAIDSEDTKKLKQLSDQTIHSASTGKENSLILAIVNYSIGKILSRQDYRTLKGWNSFNKIIRNSIKVSINDLENDNEKKFRQDLSMIKKAINKISGKFKRYVKEVFEKAEINKASRIHEHGVSLEKTAKMFGITMFDLQNYSGQTGISEVGLNNTIGIKSRVNFLEDIFSE